MKGDFTRFTFRPDKHYTSVRMQQGRLQLDSDWNEQVDIQAHLYRTQVVDLIGAESGVPTSENDPDQQDKAYKDSFKVSVTPDGGDLTIMPGHFYVNGTLCELEATSVEFKVVSSSSSSSRINVSTLIVDGQKLEKDQWVEISDSRQILQINGEINTQTLELPLNGLVNQPGQLCRIVTYKTQPDYPNPEYKDKDDLKDGLYLIYLDVWQRHITTVEDPGLREVALNIPDTTTRTKTVWQLRVQPFNRKFIQEASTSNSGRDKLLSTLDQLNAREINQTFEQFLQKVTVPNPESLRESFKRLLAPDQNQQKLRDGFETLLAPAQNQQKLRDDFEKLLDQARTSGVNQQKLQNDFKELLDKTTGSNQTAEDVKKTFALWLEKVTVSDETKQQWCTNFKESLKQVVLSDPVKQELQDTLEELLAQDLAVLESVKQELRNDVEKLLSQNTISNPDWQDSKNQFKESLKQQIAQDIDQQKLWDALEKLSDNITVSNILLNKVNEYQKSYKEDKINPEHLNNQDGKELINKVWQEFIQKDKKRQVYLNACAKLCASSGISTSNRGGYRRLENQLYRVEIHEPGEVGDQQSVGERKKATFKWSRDNGSIVSIIENHETIQKGFITIRNSAQDAWASSKTGQWIEILDEERELKGLPGQLARLNRVSGNKIEFDASSFVGDRVQKPTKVRRWDHMTKEASILTRTEWVELEAGIKVKFDKDSEYKTGDYWLIPARATTNDIEWPNAQAKDLNKRQPLQQPALGIDHDYALLAAVKVENGNFLIPSQEQDYRFIFPALVNAFDKRGGVIEGDLGIGIDSNEKPIARLQVRANNFIKGKGKISQVSGTTVTGTLTGDDATAFMSELHPGDLLKIGEKIRVVVTITGQDSLTVEQSLTPITSLTDFEYQRPIARLEGDQDKAKFTVLANGYTGIGTFAPQTTLEVNGKTRTTDLDVTGRFASETFQGATFAVTKNPTSNNPTTYGLIQASTDENAKRVEFVPAQAKIFTFTNDSQVGIGAINFSSRFGVLGNVAIGDTNFLASNTIPQDGLIVKGAVGIGTSNTKNKLDVLGAVAIGASFAGIHTAPTDGLLVEGNLSVGTQQTKNKLDVLGAVAIGASFAGIHTAPTDGLLVEGNLSVGTQQTKNKLDVLGAVAIGSTFAGIQTAPVNGLLVDGKVAIGTATPDTKAKLHVHGGVVRVSANDGFNENYVQIGRSESHERCDFETNYPQYYFNQAITINPQSLNAQDDNDSLIVLKIPAGKFNDNGHNNVKHYGLFTEDSIVKAKAFEGDGSDLTGVVKTTGDNVWDGKLTVKGSTSLASNGDTTVGIGVEQPKSRLTVNGNAAIGESYSKSNTEIPPAPKNGLLVEGYVGIGVFELNSDETDVNLKAKLEIQGESADKQKAALSVTDVKRKNLLWVRNDGNVGIGISNLQEIQDKLHIAGSVKATDVKCDRLIIGDAQLPDIPSGDPKLYVNGDLAIEKKLYVKGIAAQTIKVDNQDVTVLKANEITGSVFKQVSSKTLKEQVTDLSSQEATEALKTLNPVKFIYTEDATKHLNAGFIAEDTSDLLTSPDKQAVKILDVVAILTKAVKDQQAISEELSEVVKNQRDELEILQEKLRVLEERDIEKPRSIDLFNSPLIEEPIRRASKTSRHADWSLYRKLKRFIRRLFTQNLRRFNRTQ